MRVTIENASFSPAELEAVTGLSVDSQRDWRKRGLLPQKEDRKWTRFELTDVVFVMAMKAFSEMGVVLEDAKDAASIAILPVLDFAEMLSANSGSASKLRSVRATGGPTRFIVAVRKGARNSVLRVDSLINLQDWLDHQKGSRPVVCCVFDCLAAAEKLQDAHGGPVITHRVEEK